MTDQHRATPEQWRLIEDDDAQVPACLLELRARVEELEAKYETQRLATLEWGKDVDNHGRWIDDHLKRIMALEAGQQPRPSDVGQSLRQPSPATIAECGGPCEQGFEHCDCGLLEQLNPEPAPTDSLVERVMVAGGMGLTDSARAAIREVAAWLRERTDGYASDLLDEDAGE
jgi:hypothetical protein